VPERHYAAITVGGYTVYKLVQNHDDIYFCLEPILGHDMANVIAYWCASADRGSKFETGRNDVTVNILYF
jgi:hypothetical protein